MAKRSCATCVFLVRKERSRGWGICSFNIPAWTSNLLRIVGGTNSNTLRIVLDGVGKDYGSDCPCYECKAKES